MPAKSDIPSDKLALAWSTAANADVQPTDLDEIMAQLNGPDPDGDHDADDDEGDSVHAVRASIGRSAAGIVALAAGDKPYGDVRYADPKNGKYPIDTEAHVRAAWSYISMPKNSSTYPLNGVTLDSVKAKIQAAGKRFGIDFSSES